MRACAGVANEAIGLRVRGAVRSGSEAEDADKQGSKPACGMLLGLVFRRQRDMILTLSGCEIGLH